MKPSKCHGDAVHLDVQTTPLLTPSVCRQLSGVKIVDMDTLTQAIEVLHDEFRIPHIIITSVSFITPDHPPSHLSVIGSTMTSDRKARTFKISFPSIDCYFCGTGDMFGALITSRIREAVSAVSGLRSRTSWLSDDDVAATELPLARAAEKVLASMHQVLAKTQEAMPAVIERTWAELQNEDRGDEDKAHYVKSKAAELQLVTNLDSLRTPSITFAATKI